MNAHHQLLGLHVPGRSWLHRAPVAVKMLGMLALSLGPLLLRSWPVTAGLVVLCAAGVLSAGVGVRRALALPTGVLVMLGLLAGYQLVWGSVAEAVVVCGNLLVCLYASRMLVLTTPAPVLLDALVAASRPLRVVGVDPERIGLAVALMLRSIPHLFGSFETVRDAARARGLERNLLARVSPVVVGAVAYARATGEALAARGLAEGEPRPVERAAGDQAGRSPH